MSWVEVESKIKIKDVRDARKQIKKIAKFVKIETKKDRYYSLNEDVYPKKSLRVRKKGKKVEVNFKQWLSYVKGVHAKKETEFEVSDLEGFFELIKDFGFKKWLMKEKKTELYRTKDGVNIELNYIRNLGWFIEIEILCRKKDVIKSRKKILELREILNIKEREIERKGYTKELWYLKKRK